MDSPRTWRYRVDYPNRNSDARLTHTFATLDAAIDFVAANYPDRATVYDRVTDYVGRIVPTGPLWQRVTWHERRRH